MLDLEKPLRTTSGLSVRVLARDLDNDHPLVVAIMSSFGREFVHCFTLEGVCIGTHAQANNYKIINPPVKCTVWVNMYGGLSKSADRSLGYGLMYATRELAEANIREESGYMRTIPLTWEE